MKLKTFSKALIGVSALATSLSASAMPVNLLNNLPLDSNSGNVLFSDNSAEYLINCAEGASGCDSTSGDTTVDVGDRLRGIFVIDDISARDILGASSGADELAGIFDVTVTNKLVGSNASGNASLDYQFGVTPSFATEFGLSAGAAMAWFVDPNHEFARESSTGQSVTDLEGNITNGSLLWSTGFSGDAFWNAANLGTADIAAISLGNIAGGQFAMGLNYLDNHSGLIFKDIGCLDEGNLVMVEQCANGSILSPSPRTGSDTPFDVWDDVNFNSYVVPVPAAAWLFGSALIGLVGVSKRKKS